MNDYTELKYVKFNNISNKVNPTNNITLNGDSSYETKVDFVRFNKYKQKTIGFYYISTNSYLIGINSSRLMTWINSTTNNGHVSNEITGVTVIKTDKLNTGIIYVNGEKINVVPYTGNTTKGYIGTGDSDGLIFYYLKLYQDGTLSNHYICVKRKLDNHIGLYDKVTDTFYDYNEYVEEIPILNFNNVKAIQIPEGNVTKIEDKDGKMLWGGINLLAYGIQWTTTGISSPSTACERIGNLELHKTLPILSKFKLCVHQGKEIQYYLNPNDGRFKENPTILTKDDITFTSCEGLPSGVVSCDENSEVKYCCTNDIFADYKYLYSYLAIKTENDACVVRIVHIDTTTKTAYINDKNQVSSKYVSNTATLDSIISAGYDYTVELGASLNGYDGEIGVDTGGTFYQWSVDGEGTNNLVWISEYKCVPYAKEVKRHIVGHNRACLLRTAFNDSKWGWIGTLQSNTAVNVINYKSNLRGDNNPSNFDLYLGVDNFRTQLGKAATNMPLATMRQYTQKLPDHQVLYKLLWEALVWCWCIEYAELDIKKAFNSNLTSDGYRQGGLGEGMISINDYGNYCNAYNLTPSNYTLHLGNNTGFVSRDSRTFTIPVSANAYWNGYYLNRVTSTRDSSNKILTITAIPTAYPNDWNMYAQGTVVCGTVRYTVSGLTDDQTIIFKTPSANTTVIKDGTYDINWGYANSNRLIAFSKALSECNITITIESAPGGNLVSTQKAWNVPHWRGFNVFFYGDSWINVENFLSKYDSTKKKRIYYWTDDVTKFDNSIDNKEHQIEDGGNCQTNWIKEFVLGTQGAMIPRSYGNGKNVYHWDNVDASIHATFAGGSFGSGSSCGLGYLASIVGVGFASSSYGFFTTTILD